MAEESMILKWTVGSDLLSNDSNAVSRIKAHALAAICYVNDICYDHW